MSMAGKPKRSSTTLIGIAGVHYVVSELSRRGVIALPTVKNTAAYDIVAMNVEGTRHANIQVKTSGKRASFFPMPDANDVRSGPHDYYVFVRWLKEEQRFEGFLLKGREAKKAVQETIRWQKRKIAEGTRETIFPAAYVEGDKGLKGPAWHKAWERWMMK